MIHTRQLVKAQEYYFDLHQKKKKTQEHQKWFQYMPGSYPITTTHIESPLHIWDDFVGVYTPVYWRSWGF
jgi:hypothetical protein